MTTENTEAEQSNASDQQGRNEALVSCEHGYREKFICICRMLADEQRYSTHLEKIIGNQRKELARLNGN